MRPTSRWTTLAVLAAAALALTATETAPPAAAAEPRPGGILRVGLTTSPPTLDFVFSTTVVTRQIGIHGLEGW
jgi:ABC-type sugar transport system substrate-binding protein